MCILEKAGFISLQESGGYFWSMKDFANMAVIFSDASGAVFTIVHPEGGHVTTQQIQDGFLDGEWFQSHYTAIPEPEDFLEYIVDSEGTVNDIFWNNEIGEDLTNEIIALYEQWIVIVEEQ